MNLKHMRHRSSAVDTSFSSFGSDDDASENNSEPAKYSSGETCAMFIDSFSSLIASFASNSKKRRTEAYYFHHEKVIYGRKSKVESSYCLKGVLDLFS